MSARIPEQPGAPTRVWTAACCAQRTTPHQANAARRLCEHCSSFVAQSDVSHPSSRVLGSVSRLECEGVIPVLVARLIQTVMRATSRTRTGESRLKKHPKADRLITNVSAITRETYPPDLTKAELIIIVDDPRAAFTASIVRTHRKDRRARQSSARKLAWWMATLHGDGRVQKFSIYPVAQCRLVVNGESDRQLNFVRQFVWWTTFRNRATASSIAKEGPPSDADRFAQPPRICGL